MKQIAILLLMLCADLAYASGNGHAAPPDAKWKVECGSCHLAYPPQLLSRDNWQQLMGKLDKHFGANAMLDARDTKDILAFLQLKGAEVPIHSAASLRISDTPWFRRKHRNVSDAEWVHPDVKSRSNCTACHIDPGERLGMTDCPPKGSQRGRRATHRIFAAAIFGGSHHGPPRTRRTVPL